MFVYIETFLFDSLGYAYPDSCLEGEEQDESQSNGPGTDGQHANKLRSQLSCTATIEEPVGRTDRITSYNVCYTKLLRCSTSLKSLIRS